MDLILWRHADAAPGDPDAERALSPKGEKQAQRMADWLATHLPDDCRIIVSPAVRTRQTVEPLGRAYTVEPALLSGSEPEDVLRAAGWPDAGGTVLVVGHQPTMGQTAALLLSGQAQDWSVHKAGIWWFVQREAYDPYGPYLKAVMGPELLTK
jgi:phosphohistidine phosphatase